MAGNKTRIDWNAVDTALEEFTGMDRAEWKAPQGPKPRVRCDRCHQWTWHWRWKCYNGRMSRLGPICYEVVNADPSHKP